MISPGVITVLLIQSIMHMRLAFMAKVAGMVEYEVIPRGKRKGRNTWKVLGREVEIYYGDDNA